MKSAFLILSVVLLLSGFSSCNTEDKDDPVGVSARFDGISWSTSDVEVVSDLDGVTIQKLSATGDDDKKITFWFDRLGLSQSNKTTSFRSRSTVLNSFSYVVTNDDLVNIYWQTATETNLYYFEMEWSFDNFNFNYLDNVYAQGTSSTPVNYEYPFNMTLQDGQVAYVRMRIVDYDGSSSYSPTLTITTTFPVSVIDESGVRRKCYDGGIQLTEFDTKEKVLSGTFFFRYRNWRGDEVLVTDGKLSKIRF